MRRTKWMALLPVAVLSVACGRNSSPAVDDALKNEYRYGIATVNSGETRAGAERFASGVGRHGKF